MAERAIEKVEDELNCPVCFGIYTNPKLLQCSHVCCENCLVQLVVRDQLWGQLILTCPICRHDTPVPANGVAGLQPAVHINHFLDIVQEHKIAAATPKVCCPEHVGKELEYFCPTCAVPVCVKCALKGGKHYNHDCSGFNEVFKDNKLEMTASLQPMEKHLTTINKALAQLDTRCGEISDQQAAIEADIRSTFRKIQASLDARKTKLIDQLHQITQRKLKSLAVQKDQLETTMVSVSSCLDFMKDKLRLPSN